MLHDLFSKSKIDSISSILTILFKLGLFLGVSIFLIYCLDIGYFPSGVTLGDGLVFILCAIVFSFLFAMFMIPNISLGVVLVSVISLFLKCCVKILNIKRCKYGEEKEVYNVKYFNMFVVFVALLGFIVILGFSWPSDIDDMGAGAIIYSFLSISFLNLLLISFVNGLMLCLWIMFVKRRTKLHDYQSGSVKSTHSPNDLLVFSGVIFFLMVIITVGFGGMGSRILVGSMNTLGLRSENVIVHVKKPYDVYADLHGVIISDSKFGPLYKSIKGVNILMNGLGDNIVIEVDEDMDDKSKKKDGGKVTLIVPKGEVFIVKE
ncbi:MULTISPECIES: hypothetical protein [Cobetia]|uniref:hypothetical protein n=1 Tax=Cobetia TaxID=204286 RepID=UPI0011155A20|nr:MULTISPECIES: hypothetical protein [Cobetia]